MSKKNCSQRIVHKKISYDTFLQTNDRIGIKLKNQIEIQRILFEYFRIVQKLLITTKFIVGIQTKKNHKSTR